eukprot:TRINITY_DN23959_c0_g1_i1.p1 TRINITY_DN23959_c0_g1~~TRINITY_DN23959_c0_g1_i1.p1  ORF type:complete len:227 (-),score=32.65 TRINITY_DN23959_c0_g1_i1:168-848(-)
MASNGDVWQTPKPSLMCPVYDHNKFKAKNASYLSKHVMFKRLDSIAVKPGESDWNWRSRATNFAKGGIDFHGKNYVRDPRTGVWFNSEDTPTPGMKTMSAVGPYAVKFPQDVNSWLPPKKRPVAGERLPLVRPETTKPFQMSVHPMTLAQFLAAAGQADNSDALARSASAPGLINPASTAGSMSLASTRSSMGGGHAATTTGLLGPKDRSVIATPNTSLARMAQTV